MKVLAFAATNNSQSINKQLVSYAASLVTNASVDMVNIHDYELPIYSQDREAELGQPELAKDFFQKIGDADVIIVSFAEHNGTYTAAYKNLFDWMSRINQQVFQHKKVVYLATSPGPSGANSVLTTAITSAPFFAAELKGSLSVPNFYDNFDVESKCLINKELDKKLREIIAGL
ncbi:NADPH-dependent FMN reductase [Thalassotalea profundi]|uniref:FMN reductase n=1 Tax=Thalassotalea profundi TaxID=2036687 RepID=A0ABQ3J1Z0_9GAMM|nr:NAD(P)H-dependent oxidoreductase [Thalassotalea profundi]GHE99999.1 FMN reductase [Thalassotalea profundi]